jgi:hypothetical protein
MTPIDVPSGPRAYPDPDKRRSTPASRRMTQTLREQKDERDAQVEARQERFFVKKEEPDTPGIAEARREAEELRADADAAAATLARRA